MASVVTSEFVRSIHVDDPPFTLIEQQSLLSRLIQAIGSAARLQENTHTTSPVVVQLRQGRLTGIADSAKNKEKEDFCTYVP